MQQKTISRLTKVKQHTGCSRSFIYQKMKTGEFPASISLGPRAVGWLDSDIDAWIESRVSVSRNRGVQQ